MVYIIALLSQQLIYEENDVFRPKEKSLIVLKTLNS